MTFLFLSTSKRSRAHNQNTYRDAKRGAILQVAKRQAGRGACAVKSKRAVRVAAGERLDAVQTAAQHAPSPQSAAPGDLLAYGTNKPKVGRHEGEYNSRAG